MSDSEPKLIQAAIETFARYGFRRTTMGDIAKTAGLSRQTLYASYSNKEEILAAAIEALGHETLANLEVQWATASDVAEVLAIFCEQITVKEFEMIRNMPDAEDLISGLTGESKAALGRVQASYSAALSDKLRTVSEIDAKSAAVMAEFFVLAAKGLKHVAEDTDHLRNQLSLLSSAAILRMGQPVNT